MDLDPDEVTRAFGAEISVDRPDGDDQAFFLVKRREDVDHEEFFRWLAGRIGGTEKLLFHHPDGLFVVWTSFGVSRSLESFPWVALVGGVDVDVERLRSFLHR